MSMKYTKEQEKAINTLDRSILVSAAAGSGKTAILVERILRIILEGRANVDELLVVTFTRAAAAEMKTRLSGLIRRHMTEHPEDAPALRRQLAMMYRAYITSIDSFANRIDREFFYEIDIEPDFGTCDEVQAEIFKRDAADELIEELFENDDMIPGCSFREFMRLYSSDRSDEGFKQDMIAVYNKLRTIHDYFDWARDKAELLDTSMDELDGSALQAMMLEDAEGAFETAEEAALRVRDLLFDAGLGQLYAEKLEPEIEAICSIRDELRHTGDAAVSAAVNAVTGKPSGGIAERIDGIAFARMTLKKIYKEAYEPVKDEVTALRNIYKGEIDSWRKKYSGSDLEERVREMNATYRYTLYYIDLLGEFEKRYAAKKAERHVVDFADMEHFAVSILKNDEAADILRRRFKYIFVDEYQDTNNIQEYLISKIARPDNVFRVGDVKQSIYKFRQAEPEIFERVYREYSDPDNPAGISIDLSRNFRTNSRTIDYVNKVFGTLMEGYDDRAKLYAGLECDDEYDMVPEVHILTDDGSDQGELTDGEGSDDDEAPDLSKEEAEAAYIAGLIEDIIGKEFYDTAQKKLRKAEPGDIAVLYRSVKVTGDILVKALKNLEIQGHVEEAEKYFDTVEIGIAVSLLACIDNMKKDVPLIAVLHSPVFAWSPDELAKIRIAHNDHLRTAEAQRREAERLAEHETETAASEQTDSSEATNSISAKRGSAPAYWEALKWYREQGPEGSLRDKAREASAAILGWRRDSRMMPLADFVWKVLTESGYYTAAGAMNGGARRQANLRSLADKAVSYSRETVASLSSFVRFLDVLKERNSGSISVPAAGDRENAVRISTIHKSKGLEYPFVIVGGMGRRLRHPGGGSLLSFDPNIGVGLPYIDPARKYKRSTLMQSVISSRIERDTFRENLRVLYVAMTRARNKLIMVGTTGSEEKLMEYSARPDCYYKAMNTVLKTACNTYHISKPDRRPGSERSAQSDLPDPASVVMDDETSRIYMELDRRFGYEYPYQDMLSAKAKYSVSAVRRMELEAERNAAAASSDTSSNEELQDNLQDDTGSALIGTADSEVVQLWNLTEETKRRAGSADIGIAYHRIMEFLDFTIVMCGSSCEADDPEAQSSRCGSRLSADIEYIKERADYLASQNALDADAYRAVDIDNIAAFFGSDIGRRAVEAAKRGNLKKEKPFTLRTERRGQEMLVQGVIDCCFEEDDGMVLIDYKSVFIRPGRQHEAEIERIRREYRVQIELYAEALGKGTDKAVKEAYLYLFTTGEAIRMM